MEEKLLTLNGFGYNIVKITNPITHDETYYLYDIFVPVDVMGSQAQTHKHKIKGKNITEFLSMQGSALHLRTSNLEENTVRSNINALPQVHREYSSQFLWENFLSN